MRRINNKKLAKPEDRIKEKLGYEIETKLQFTGQFSHSTFSNVKTIIEKSGFILVKGLEDLRWIFNFDYYAHKHNGRLIRSIVLIWHPSTPRFWIRHKTDSRNTPHVLIRKEENILVEEPLTSAKRKVIIKENGSKLNTSLLLAGRIRREKYYFMIQNPNSTRTYSVSLDKCRHKNNSMCQLEIEYKWILELTGQSQKGREKAIKKDIKTMTQVLLASELGSYFQPTSMTKWEWLLKNKKML